MTAFRVGMRVRIVRDLGNTPWAVGSESVVCGFGPPPRNAPASFVIRLKDFAFISFAADELEPILDAHEPCEADFKRDMDRLLEGEAETVR